jgi:hypothetical protein
MENSNIYYFNCKGMSSKVLSKATLGKEPGAVATIDQYKDNTDPKYIGPGTWNTIHLLASQARTKAQQTRFIAEMKSICTNFPCPVCRGHCGDYIRTHPMEEYLDLKVQVGSEKLNIGMFVWSWKFHNAVNARLKKPIMSWDTAYNLYMGEGSLVCSASCSEAEQPMDNFENGFVDDMDIPTIVGSYSTRA